MKQQGVTLYHEAVTVSGDIARITLFYYIKQRLHGECDHASSGTEKKGEKQNIIMEHRFYSGAMTIR